MSEPKDIREGYVAGWDAAVDVACKKAMAVQDGFRKLLVSKRSELLNFVTTKDPNTYREDIAALEAEVSQGEALVGTLGDVIRNIAEMKGNAP